jgi:hypothetical protein
MNGASILTFVILSSVFLWFIISGRGRWWPKFAAIVGVISFAAIVWHSAISFTGWPTHDKLPKIALFVSGYVIEPDDQQDGAIYLWLLSPPADSNIYEYSPKEGEPRAYVLKYTREMHEQVQAALIAQAQGKRVVFSTEGNPANGARRVSDEEGGNNRGGGNSGTRGGAPGFYILPNAPFVSKD